MNTADSFSGRAANYSQSRPDYSVELIDHIYEKYGLSDSSIIADIGSGTGKLSRQLLARHSTVYCVEPNEDMRSTAERELSAYSGFHSIAGDAENTKLPDDFADFITAAQSFHWFDVIKFRSECSRILKKGGRVFLIWNVRAYDDALNQEWSEVFRQYCPDFHGFSNGISRDDPKIKAFFMSGYDYAEFVHMLNFDRAGFIKRSLSSSYSLKESDARFEEYLSELNRLFDRFERNGILSISNSSVVYSGEITSANPS